MYKRTLKLIGVVLALFFITGCFASLDTLRYWDGAKDGAVVQNAPCTVSLELPALKIKEVVMFDWDSNIVKADGQKTLDKVAKLMKENPEINLQLKGYASAEGNETYNQGLSQRRVDAVKVELMMRGVKSNRMTTEAKGETTMFGEVLNHNRRTTILSAD